MLKIAIEENEKDLIKEIENNFKNLLTELEILNTETRFSGELDKHDCYIEIHPGAGGTESCDWAEMLLRMYIRWAEQKKFKYEIIEEQSGEVAGIKSATISIEGENTFGWLKNESGIHRLVRISPFDSNAKRHTSFASVWIYPKIEEEIEITIEDKDLKIDTYRASGAGGQHVNKTDSAVRITHLPTKIVVQSQNSRSQHQNKAECMKMLKSRLYEMEVAAREAETNEANANKSEIGWGNQIRSYVMQPYQLVKDTRNGIEESNVQSVLNGNIDKFLIGKR
jgi:peptide chain release factor 2